MLNQAIHQNPSPDSYIRNQLSVLNSVQGRYLLLQPLSDYHPKALVCPESHESFLSSSQIQLATNFPLQNIQSPSVQILVYEIQNLVALSRYERPSLFEQYQMAT